MVSYFGLKPQSQATQGYGYVSVPFTSEIAGLDGIATYYDEKKAMFKSEEQKAVDEVLINSSSKYKNWDEVTAFKYKKVVEQIIADDKNAPKNKDFSKVVSLIMKISDEYDTNPIEIACIMKKESNFDYGAKRLNNYGGKGLMQLTSIVPKDMFQRTNKYHEKLPAFLKQFKDSGDLFNKLQTDMETNIRMGILTYHHKLQNAKGNIKTAVTNYNGSKTKHEYGRIVYKDILKYQKLFDNFHLL